MSRPILRRDGRPPEFPEEPPAVPITPDTAKDRASYVRSLIKRLERLQTEGKTKEEIEAAVPEFKRDYPKLYDMVIAPGYNKQSLQTMLVMLDRMALGQLSQHEASVIVGQRLVDNFVKPQLNDPSTST